MLKKFFVILFIGSLGANFFSLYVLDKALFFRKHIRHIEQSSVNQGVHLRTVDDLSKSGIKPSGVFIGGSLVKFWNFKNDLPLAISNQGGLEEKINTDYQKFKDNILGSGIDLLFINSGFCEIHTAVNAGKDVDAVINNNFNILKQIIEESLADGMVPVATTLLPVRPVIVFPYTKFLSIPSRKKITENKAIQEYNQMIRQYASNHHLYVIDFEKALADEHGFLKRVYSVTDGEHLDIGGYQQMDKVFAEGLMKILADNDKK
jgi:lysophospholipase L1-like esterase